MHRIVLMISTDATRTGTPVLLLNMLRWFKKNSDIKIVIILHKGGELLSDYRSLYKVYIWPDFLPFVLKIRSKNFILKIFKNSLQFVRRQASYLFVTYLKSKYSVKLIYSNTARNGEILSFIRKKFSAEIILHVHEGARTLEIFDNKGFVNYNISVSDTIITVSEFVKQTLLEKFKPKQEIRVIPGGIEIIYQFRKQSRALLRQEGIGDDKKVIMCCGWLDWHKGTDLFIQLALYLSAKNEKLHFVWLGGQERDVEYRHMNFDMQKLNLADRITIIPSKPNAQEYIGCASIFLMLSREESFSLVTLEAGLAKIPVLCFDKSGGPLEIVNNDSRFIVPYADVLKMGNCIENILDDSDLYSAMGEYLHDRVINNYSIEKCSSAILDLIDLKL